MSLDVYLTLAEGLGRTEDKIYIRENGATKAITVDEWNKKHPDIEPAMLKDRDVDDDVFWMNITHNLASMATQADLYKYLWRPDENGITKAHQLIEPLRAGLELLKSDPVRFKKFDPDNGWGSYGGLVNFVEEYLKACIKYPDADVSVSR